MWPAPIPRMKALATETDSEERHANGVRGNVSQETENVKCGSRTRLGADISMADLFVPKYRIRMASWNVRTLYQSGELQQVLREMTTMVTIKWKYGVLVRQDGPTQRGESLRWDTPYYTQAAQTTYIEVASQ